MVQFEKVRVITVGTAKSKLERIIDQVIKNQEPVVIQRGENHVMIAPYHLPTTDELELERIGREMDKTGVSVEESAETTEAI